MARLTSLKLMALGTLGALAGATVFFLGALSSPESRAFLRTPEFLAWFMINEVLFAIYPVLWAFVLGPISGLKEQPARVQREIILSSILAFGLFMLLPLAGTMLGIEPLPLPHFDLRLLILVGIGFCASALPISVCIWLTQVNVDATIGKSASAKAIEKYLDYRDELHRYLTVLGALLSLFILASAALRTAAIATGATNATAYPPMFVLLLGAYYTGLVAVFYFPAQQTLVSAGRRLLDAAFPLPVPDSDNWGKVYADRKDLEELLELDASIAQRFTTGITLLAPFLSGIFSLLVGK